ncbi:T9SS type A sorting domain-containing protein [Flavihumibacter stibioxidans]|uniref:Secretion system C-terminal sorting domain-containing protein n=1 Tax=Flavihumibacter stibioxidans TaxID=1834163 RepID=A0ABR7MAN7_9BACT|nr:T9SS type A sorting domain-containing protein [Flavihumibacter stibioxidans]MBC6492017.1 hypothetical protein [Flavihumibacter stibioxidans]
MRILTLTILLAVLCHATKLAGQPIIVAETGPDRAAVPVNPGMGSGISRTVSSKTQPSTNPLVIKLEDPVMTSQGKVMLSWTTGHAYKGGYFNVERSVYPDGPFEVVAVLRQDSAGGRFVDELPLRGKSHYRLKWVHADGTSYFSRLAATSFSGDMTCRFYPNPVDNMLIVRSEQALDLVLTDQNGKTRLNLKLTAGLQTVDVSNLEKGMYIITITQMETGRVMTEKLLKN